jgi:enamine deaminase RidA (YjgF/YER057c/UK114 family)
VAFGAAAASVREDGDAAALQVALPVLLGPTEETIARALGAPVSRSGCTLLRSAERVAGLIVADAAADLETAARDVYRSVFAASTGLHLYRVWNYVPHINVVEHGLENYRRFCRGRSEAFEAHFGAAFQRKLPAASAVGAMHGPLAVAFLAGEAAPRHFENPRQVPAFEYPAIYGPRPPSFSRATLVARDGASELFISGTAAIRGHVTVAAHDLHAQLACTRENLELIAVTAGAGPRFGQAEGWQRSFKVYVRHAEDLGAVERDLKTHLLSTDDDVTYLQADICRADLLVEIEAVLTRG